MHHRNTAFSHIHEAAISSQQTIHTSKLGNRAPKQQIMPSRGWMIKVLSSAGANVVTQLVSFRLKSWKLHQSLRATLQLRPPATISHQDNQLAWCLVIRQLSQSSWQLVIYSISCGNSSSAGVKAGSRRWLLLLRRAGKQNCHSCLSFPHLTTTSITHNSATRALTLLIYTQKRWLIAHYNGKSSRIHLLML